MRQTGDFGRHHLDRRKTPSPAPIVSIVCIQTGYYASVSSALAPDNLKRRDGTLPIDRTGYSQTRLDSYYDEDRCGNGSEKQGVEPERRQPTKGCNQN